MELAKGLSGCQAECSGLEILNKSPGVEARNQQSFAPLPPPTAYGPEIFHVAGVRQSFVISCEEPLDVATG